MADDIPEAAVFLHRRDAARAFEEYCKMYKSRIRKAFYTTLYVELKNGHQIHFITDAQFDMWKTGRTYRFYGTRGTYRSGYKVVIRK